MIIINFIIAIYIIQLVVVISNLASDNFKSRKEILVPFIPIYKWIKTNYLSLPEDKNGHKSSKKS